MTDRNSDPYLKVLRLGAQGDGMAVPAGDREGRPVFVPFVLPGEMVEAKGGALPVIIEASADRVEPFCTHFGSCGGCQVQHASRKLYTEWKTGILHSALQREGIDVTPSPLVEFARASRRRAVLTARKTERGWIVGYAMRGSHTIIDLDACPILVSSLQEAVPGLRKFLELLDRHGIGRKPLRITLLSAANGIDCSLSVSERVSDKLRREIAEEPSSRPFIRIAINGETIIERDRPRLSAGIASVSPPSEAFVQAVELAEEAMAGLTLQHLGKCKRVADLFCGFGVFGLRLAENSVVHGTDNEQSALAAMERAWRETGGRLKQLTHERRDLFRRPMMAEELRHYDGVVFDPPRAGAEAQAREIARSNVSRVAAISCNPQTLARDLRILIDGGFAPESVTPIDQFAHTPHLEAVALLSRKRSR